MKLNDRIGLCLIKDQHRLRRRLKQAGSKPELLEKIKNQIDASIKKVTDKVEMCPPLLYPTQLPVVAYKNEIIQAIQKHNIVIVSGDTGSGKSTQIGKMCLEAGFGFKGLIGHTQPRRIAAKSIADRVAQECKKQIGEMIGFKIRFNDVVGENCYIKFMTDGILLNEIQFDKFLSNYEVLIIDEAHERSLNIDLLLGFLKKVSLKRKNLKIIITSATIEIDKFSQFFHHAPVIEVPGKIYPITTHYITEHKDLFDNLLFAIGQSLRDRQGDILVFLSGQREIWEAMKLLSKQNLHGAMILPLYAKLSLKEQRRIFESTSKRKIILATNVAETSITVPNITHVIDSGLVRLSRYNYRSKVQRLPIEAIAKANAEQRKGRCGRTQEGVCYRLYSEEDFDLRAEYTTPEIKRTNLAFVILLLSYLKMGDIEDYPFIDPPEHRYIKDGKQLLFALNAVDDNEITPTGKLMAKIPVDPRLSRMLVACQQYACLKEMIVIVAQLSIQDVREYPFEQKEKARQLHQKFDDPKSEFISIYKLWEHICEQRSSLSNKKFRNYCYDHFLSFTRILEWFDLVKQLKEVTLNLNFKINQQPASYQEIHQAILTGLIDKIGLHDVDDIYQGPRNLKFKIFPGSPLKKKQPAALVAFNIIELKENNATTVAQIDLKWLEAIAKHLIKKEYYEPHYDVKRGEVLAKMGQTLFGLKIGPAKNVSYAKINPDLARKIYIKEALVEREGGVDAGFYKHNNAVLDILEYLQTKIRHAYPIINWAKVESFYLDRIPAQVFSTRALLKCLKIDNQIELNFTHSDVSYEYDASRIIEQYPDKITLRNLELNLNYRFDLEHEQDGITFKIPLAALNQYQTADFMNLVPGLHNDLWEYLIRGLPKYLRIRLQPISEFIRQMQNIHLDDTLIPELLLEKIANKLNMKLDQGELYYERLPAYLKPHFEIQDENNNLIISGDNLEQLKLHPDIKDKIQYQSQSNDAEPATQWQFEDILFEDKVSVNGLEIMKYAGLQKVDKGVVLCHFDKIADAKDKHEEAVKYLLQLSLSDKVKYLEKEIRKYKPLNRSFENFTNKILTEQILLGAFNHLDIDYQHVMTKDAFDRAQAVAIKWLVPSGMAILDIMKAVMPSYDHIANQLGSESEKNDTEKDVQWHLDLLLSPNFVVETPLEWLSRYPVYLQGIAIRLEKYKVNPAKDVKLAKACRQIWRNYLTILERAKLQSKDISALNDFQYLFEEYRISLFAQKLKTKVAISKQRLIKKLEKI